MSILDQFLNNQALRNFGTTFTSPSDSPMSFAQTFGNTPQNITPLRTNTTLPNLPGGNNLTFGTNQIGGGISTGFPGVSMPGTGGIGMANTLAPTRPQRGFGSRIADVFRDQNRFADALAGVAALTGTPAGEALGIRDALRTPQQTGSLGTLYNVFDQQGNYIKQVTSRDPEYARLINDQQFILQPADTTSFDQLGIEKGGLEKETIFDPKTNKVTFIGGKLLEQKTAILDLIRARDTITRTANLTISQINTAINLTREKSGIKENIADTVFLDRLPGGDAALLRGELTSIGGSNFVSVINAMKQASKNGGALGSVSETELEVFSTLNFVINPDTVGTGQELRKRLEEMKASLIQGVNDSNAFAEKSFLIMNNPIPDDDKDKMTQLPPPPELLTDANIVDGL